MRQRVPVSPAERVGAELAGVGDGREVHDLPAATVLESPVLLQPAPGEVIAVVDEDATGNEVPRRRLEVVDRAVVLRRLQALDPHPQAAFVGANVPVAAARAVPEFVLCARSLAGAHDGCSDAVLRQKRLHVAQESEAGRADALEAVHVVAAVPAGPAVDQGQGVGAGQPVCPVRQMLVPRAMPELLEESGELSAGYRDHARDQQ